MKPDTEMNRLTDLLKAFISKQGIDVERSFYSKLSFLRDSLDVHTADQPGA
ncbi:hypothetical protein [Streptomyces sp. NPDC056672]|uniref:hypothetical protein n=1 Tax=Streptomyces sp. NPDC056672 TaxID=3345906 RepID=UPI0036D0C1F2